jgi:hypothetical protein
VFFNLSTDLIGRYTLYSSWCNIWDTFCSRVILAPAQHSLTELTLHSGAFLGTSSRLSLAELHFPHLCALSLRNFFFKPSIGVESFILRHAASLTRLELLACTLHANATPPISFDLDPPPPQSSYCWDSIWDRFAVELTALVVLHIDDLEFSYIFTARGIVLLDSVCQSRDTTDLAALQRFRAVVAARSCARDPEEGEAAPDILVGER